MIVKQLVVGPRSVAQIQAESTELINIIKFIGWAISDVRKRS